MNKLNINVQIDQKQSVKLTPAQIQIVEILQMGAVELQQRISQELMENPVLEESSVISEETFSDIGTASLDNDYREAKFDSYDDKDLWDGSWSDSVDEEDWYFHSGKAAEFEKFSYSSDTFHEHLLKQLIGATCHERVKQAAELVIYLLDGNGYLDKETFDIAREKDFTTEEINDALNLVRRFDPEGIGFFTLQECLKSQLDKADPLYDAICKIIDDNLVEVARGDERSIAKIAGVKKSDAAEICHIIRNLEPKPGARFSDGSAIQYIMPDVKAEVTDGQLHVCIYGAQQGLTVNEHYQDMYRSSKDAALTAYLRDRIGRAEALISNIEMRKRTILAVTRAILQHQKQFLEPGNKVLIPLTMQDIADELGIHVSTVSRAVNGKYLMLGGSTYSLRYFFSTEVNGSAPDKIRKEMRAIISNEDPSKPLSDQKIADILSGKGFEISRRTVAKYRDQEGILPKSLRKTIH